jgi:YesN/AraC family two-component response regulator
MNETAFNTATMAKVYAEQGYFEKSAEIYRHLLKLEPHRQELKAALLEVEQKLKEEKKTHSRDLTPLFEKWFDLLLRRRNLQKLKKLQNTTFNQTQKRVY